MKQSNQPILIHTKNYIINNSHSSLANSFYFSSDPNVVKNWLGPILIIGDFDHSLINFFKTKKRPQIAFLVVDFFCTKYCLINMERAGILDKYLKALSQDNRTEIVSCLYELTIPDIFVVNNSVMEADFNSANLPCRIIRLHGPGNEMLRANIFDRMLPMKGMPVVIQNGGGDKYIEPELEIFLKTLEAENRIKLTHHSIMGGSIYQPTFIPIEPQVVISCRRRRNPEINGYLIDYSTIESDWKPATKYMNAIVSGSQYIGYPEISVKEKSAHDELTTLHANLSDIKNEIIKSLEFCPLRRSEIAKVRYENYIRGDSSMFNFMRSIEKLFARNC